MNSNQNHATNVQDHTDLNVTVHNAKRQKLNGPLVDITNVAGHVQDHVSGDNVTYNIKRLCLCQIIFLFVFHVLGLYPETTAQQGHINGGGQNTSSTSRVSKLHNEQPLLRKQGIKGKGMHL